MPLGSRFRIGFFDAEQKPRRGQHGGHRPLNALLETAPLVTVDPLGDGRQPIDQLIINGPAIRFLRKTLEHFVGIGPAIAVGFWRRIFRKKAVVIFRHNSELVFQWSFEPRRYQLQIERINALLGVLQRFQVQR